MNDNMTVTFIIAALAIYANKTKGGLIPALSLLLKSGMTIDEAIDIITQYDKCSEAVILNQPLI